jgi:hypothetical protein
MSPAATSSGTSTGGRFTGSFLSLGDKRLFFSSSLSKQDSDALVKIRFWNDGGVGALDLGIWGICGLP